MRSYKRGGKDSPQAFCDLLNLLLANTVMAVGASLHLQQGERRNNYIVGGRLLAPIQLRDGKFLRVYYGLAIQGTSEGPRLKVINSGFKYQVDIDGKRWIFRYDYDRFPRRPYPPTHFHIRGDLKENCLPGGEVLEDIHFPATRVSLEAVIRLLIDQFGVSPATPRGIWRKLLAKSEADFLDIAHRGLSGPKR